MIGPLVDLGPHEVDRTAGDADPGRDGPRVRVETLEGGQQRGMDVDQPVLPAGDEVRRQHAHEAGEADQLDPCGLQRLAQRLLEGAARAVVPMVDHAMGQARAGGPGEAEGVGAVGEHQHDLARSVGAGTVVDQRLKVGAAARDQDAHSQPRHMVPPPSPIADMPPGRRSPCHGPHDTLKFGSPAAAGRSI